MADVITRFKLETTQYDSKLRDSVKGLKEVVHMNELAGKEFKEFSDKAIEAAKALGTQATGATNAKDKVKELVSSYNDMVKTYNAMSNAMKESEGGKALSGSLQQLQQRIKDAKAEMNATPGVLDKLESKFTVNIDAIKLFNIGLKAAEGALSVAKDAFFASEANVDEWGSTIASAQSVYEGFLTAINTGDISGYLNRIDEIVKAASKAYDELDRLGTMKTIQAPQTEKQNAENTRLRTMLMTGRYIAPAAGSGLKASMAEGTQLTPAQMKRLEQQLQNGMQTIVKLTGNELEQTGKAINAYYDKLAKQNGMTMEEFRKGTSSMAEFDKRLKMSRKYSEFETAHTTTITSTGSNGLPISVSRRDNAVNPYEQYKGWTTFRVDKQGQNSYNELVGLIRQQQQQTSQMYSTIGQSYRTINRAEGTTVRSIMDGGSGGGGGKGGGKTGTEIDYAPDSIKAQQAEVQRLTSLWQKAGEAVRDDYKAQLDEAQYKLDKMTGKETFEPSKLKKVQGVSVASGSELKLPDASELKKEIQLELTAQNIKVDKDTLKTLLQDAMQNGIDLMDLKFAAINEQIKNGVDIPDSAWQNIIDQYNELRRQMGLEPIEIDVKIGNIVKTGKKVEEAWTSAAQAVQSVGSALQQIEDPGAKIIGTIGQAVATVALAYAETLAQSKEKKNVWAFIAAAAAATASMVSTISSIHSSTGYSEGGVIKGNSYSGDNIGGIADDGQLVGLNAGEVVLNRAQAGVLAAGFEGGGFKNGQIVGELQGEKIVLVANRYFKRSGQGEILTWKN